MFKLERLLAPPPPKLDAAPLAPSAICATAPPAPPVPPEQIRAEAIRQCFRDMSNKLNRNQPDPEMLAKISDQCQRIYDAR